MIKERVIKISLYTVSLISLAVLFTVIAYIFLNGIQVINFSFLLKSPNYIALEKGGIFPQIIGSLCLLSVCLLFAVPLGVASGIYLAEYAPENIITKNVRFFVECLAGIPSIVIGLFGLIFLVYYLDFGPSMLAGGLSLGFMILPWTVKASEEAIKAVPQAYRKASLALGASKWQSIRSVVLKSAYPGIITGILLGAGKAIGESAVILLTTGGLVAYTPHSLLDDVGALPVYIYMILTVIPASRDVAESYAFGASLVLITMFLMISVFALFLRNRYYRIMSGGR
ncbi:MAG: phosphate ABC transporter permease PstA [Methanocellales archaeon]|nr:phosphate ABC transporter permease PstA [Methanocellales archaeon]MDD3292403.1 phosphate ABC transporter permease PstA [Methanocellales archaeon]MDD5235985.1 phosphate ABC transporter permease PstA [Methanocellales archaeon]MDD5485292.1 phosphate ABC transporter permease PstA [Methanocellales archaeon]